MDSLKDIYDRFEHLPDGHLVPSDGICPTCDELKRDNAGVKKLLAARGLKEGIRYCRCGLLDRRRGDKGATL